MKILYVASEATPFIKTGGLADVAGSLPQALQREGIDVTVVIPKYGQIPWEYNGEMEHIGHFFVDLGFRHQYAGVFQWIRDGVRYLFIDNQFYFHRPNVYGEGDDGERFIFFNKAVVQMIGWLDEAFDVVHANDWHTGLIPLYIRDFAIGDPRYKKIKSVYTIHNLKYQGVFPREILMEVGGLSENYIREDTMAFYDQINMMKAGIVFADHVTTVSATYAKEIMTAFFGEGLEGVLRAQSFKVSGIVNGIDLETYDPSTDPHIKANYSVDDLSGKKTNKQELRRIAGLADSKDVPIIAFVSRLVSMKGLDLIAHIMDEMMQLDVQMVLLGTGERRYEEMFRYFNELFPSKFRAFLTFDEKKSHTLYAGADLLMMPSLKEPCGISQLIAMRYGTLPIVRETGGLKDTVIPYNKHTGEGTGFSFANINAHELLFTVKKALALYEDEEAWESVVKQAMNANHSWDESSKKYIEIYEDIVGNK